jgi:hypothetical protein
MKILSVVCYRARGEKHMLKRASLCFGVIAAVALCPGLIGTAPAQDLENETADLAHVGLNPSSCGKILGVASGTVNVHLNSARDRYKVIVSVYNALPKTTYVVDIRCVGAIGSLDSNSQGTGAAEFDLPMSALPANDFFIDISVPNGGGGAGNYGDTFIAGPFKLN